MVLNKLGTSLKNTFRKVAGLGVVDKNTVDAIIKDLQRALLEADVDVKMVFELSERIKKEVLGKKLAPGMSLREHFIKTLYDEMVRFLGAEKGEMALRKQRILVIGLFGSGKTTTIGKLARWFKTRGLKTGLVACDTHRAAAKTQLEQIGKKAGVPVYTDGKIPTDIARNALKKSGEDVLIFDTAGRDALDKELAKELKELGKTVKADEVILVIPADIGQAARKQAEEFSRLVGITGIIISKMDGTAKGGGALAAASVAGATVKFIGTGERIEDLEQYDPERFVSRLIGYGDLQGLMEKAKEAGIKEEDVKKMMEGKFTLGAFIDQVQQMKKMGSLSKITEMVPGMGNLKIPKGVLEVQDEKMEKWIHIIKSMTDIINASRVKRIAKGSGTSETEVRDLLKHYKQAKKILRMTKGGKAFKRGPFAKLAKQLGFGGM